MRHTPGAKVTAEIAAIRGIPRSEDSISPNGHEDVKSVIELLSLVNRVRAVTNKPVGIKLVVGQLSFFDDLFQQIHRDGILTTPDFITQDSADGGTGAAPQPLMDYVGMPLRESLPLVIDLLTVYGLRERIRVIASGKLITPGKVAWAFANGADFVASARGFMFALGCIQALQCNKNTCPTGITTHRADLQHGLVPSDKAKRVAHYADKLAYSVSLIAHSCGVTEPRGLPVNMFALLRIAGTLSLWLRCIPNQRRRLNTGIPIRSNRAHDRAATYQSTMNSLAPFDVDERCASAPSAT